MEGREEWNEKECEIGNEKLQYSCVIYIVSKKGGKGFCGNGLNGSPRNGNG